MQYLGGKARLAKDLTAAIRGEVGGVSIWEPFCGGLSMSAALAAGGPGLASDTNASLIALYKACRKGWEPPEHVSESEYAAARSLPDEDPRKAFIGIGCSFGAKWFGGYARGSDGANYAGMARRSLLKKIEATRHWEIEHASFFDVAPREREREFAIYCDPPYANTTRYAGTADFDSAAFWGRCTAWAAVNIRVFVSEFECPVRHRVLWKKPRRIQVSGTQDQVRIERLFEVIT